MNLMFDVATFRVFGTKKFSARGQVVKQRAYFDLGSGSFTAVAHDVELTAIDDDFGASDRATLTCGQAKSRHARDAWQGFAPKSQRSNSLKISSRPNFAGGMPLQRKQCVIAIHAAAVIDHANQRNSSATNHDVDFTGGGVNAVFDQFLHH